ncbi:MAG: hypothetical protein IJ766_03970 [Clostridia bacterium]|nr:hypothetical protein [Clostridia bacterium]
MSCCNANEVIIAGDDRCFYVEFTNDDAPGEAVLSDGDTVQAVIHVAELKIILNGEISGDTAAFYLSEEQTRQLGAYEYEHVYLCVHIYWDNGGRYTAIKDMTLRIERCHYDR